MLSEAKHLFSGFKSLHFVQGDRIRAHMHEMSIAQNIVEIVKQNLQEKDYAEVKSVKVKIGELAGVVTESLDFCFNVIIDSTPMKGAVLDIECIPFVIECKTCRIISNSEAGIFVCPACASTDTKIVSGTELQLVEIELNDNSTEPS
jgi:hydrogenase nickel incorporation protein HypA/HybF